MAVRDVLKAARQQAGRRGGVHSPLYEWLWEHHDEVAGDFNPPSTPNWTAVAETLKNVGVLAGPTPRTGVPRVPTGDLLRRTCLRVLRDKQRVAHGGDETRRKARTTPRREQSLPPEATPAASSSLPPEDDEDDFIITAADGSILNPRKPK